MTRIQYVDKRLDDACERQAEEGHEQLGPLLEEGAQLLLHLVLGFIVQCSGFRV